MSSFPKSVQAGKPRLNKPKYGYTRYKFSDLLLDKKRKVSLENDELYRLITIKRSRGGIKERDYLNGNQISVKSQFNISEGDFVISKRQIVHGACALVSKEFEGCIVSNEYSVLRATPLIDIRYLMYLSYSVYFQQTCFHSSIGVHIEKMIFKLSDWLKWTIDIPILSEQQKIAAFLTAVDNKIEQLSKKQELLGEYKKGLMQQIFSQAIRFKAYDGSDFPDWEEKKLGDYLAHKSKKNKDNEVGLVLSVSNKKGFITQNEQFDGYQVASKDLSTYKIIEKSEYAYNPSRINVGSIARLKNNTIGIVSPMYVVFKLKNLDPVFFDNLYQTHLFKHLIKVGCSGSVRDSLNFNDMADFVFNFPSLEEQQKIASFLSSIDNKIEQVGKQLDEFKKFRKALLQQMFV